MDIQLHLAQVAGGVAANEPYFPATGPNALTDPEIAKRLADDPHDLYDGAPLAFAAYRVARECYSALAAGRIGEEEVIKRLRKAAPKSAFQHDFVCRKAFKLINPNGHGVNGPRFRNETVGWFRKTYPADSHLTAGLILLICAARWWIDEQGERSVRPRANPLITADLDEKLKSFGFLEGERKAICRMLQRDASRD